MSNLYVHYPFCKQACHYCNFHFSTSYNGREEIMILIRKELQLRAKEINSPLESIYFGGGSPSLISPKSLKEFISYVKKSFEINPLLEITLEANPDDLNEDYLIKIKEAGINRLSLGIQSFFEKDLKLMHRAHNFKQAQKALNWVNKQFENFSVDLIYGMPYTNLTEWEENLKLTLDYQPPHISAYALTVEKNTSLYHFVQKKKIMLLNDELVRDQYNFLVSKLYDEGFVNYEFSNFGKPGFFSINNQNYWNGKSYLGLGPSSHSFDGNAVRSWNVSNNHLYASGVRTKRLEIETEKLSTKDQYNEYLMISLRKLEGISLNYVNLTFGKTYTKYLEEQADRHLNQRNLFWDGDYLKVAKKAKFVTDGIAADLFII